MLTLRVANRLMKICKLYVKNVIMKRAIKDIIDFMLFCFLNILNKKTEIFL